MNLLLAEGSVISMDPYEMEMVPEEEGGNCY
jgi:hypothetical protein